MTIVLKCAHSLIFQVPLHRTKEILAIVLAAEISSEDLCVIVKVGVLFWGIRILRGALSRAVNHSKLIDIIFP